MAAIEQAIERAPEGDQKTRLQKAREGLAGAGREAIVCVGAGVLTRQLGG